MEISFKKTLVFGFLQLLIVNCFFYERFEIDTEIFPAFAYYEHAIREADVVKSYQTSSYGK